jgi:hypothetical protein
VEAVNGGPPERRFRNISASFPFLCALLSLAAPRLARADDALAPATPGDDLDVRARLAFIESRLRDGTVTANLWWYGWTVGYSTLALGQGVVALATTSAGLRTDSIVGGVSSALGVIPFFVFPFPARRAARELEPMPEATVDERREKLARAEELLEASAKAETLGRSLLTHAFVGLSAAGIGVILGVGFHRAGSGVLDGVGGIVTGEAQIWTEPTAAIDAWREIHGPAQEARWSLVPRMGGVDLVGSF